MPNNPKTKQSGVVILFAVLLVSVVLTISLTLLNIGYRQILLSRVARDSELAFFAADSARNCARYWDFVPTITARPFGYYWYNRSLQQWQFDSILANNINELTCAAGMTSGVGAALDDGQHFTRVFVLNFNLNGQPACASVSVTKNKSPQPEPGPNREIDKSTTITASGYNVASSGGVCPPAGLSSSHLVERTIQSVSY